MPRLLYKRGTMPQLLTRAAASRSLTEFVDNLLDFSPQPWGNIVRMAGGQRLQTFPWRPLLDNSQGRGHNGWRTAHACPAGHKRRSAITNHTRGDLDRDRKHLGRRRPIDERKPAVGEVPAQPGRWLLVR